MTTFTMQDLTPEQQQAVTKHEELHKMFQSMHPTIPEPTTQDILNNIALPMPPLNGSEPQPTPTGTDVPTLESVLQSIAEQFSLLSTVIKGGQENSLNVEDQSKSLQDCVSLTLQQADWFKEMVRGIIDDTYDFSDHAENAVEHVVEREVENYFDHGFNPEDHFDFADAVSDAVDDRLDDIVSDKIDDVVQEKFDDFMENATITINK